MEVIKLNKSKISEEYAAEKSLKEIIGTLEQHYQLQQQVVCQIFVNGLKLSEEDEMRLGDTQARDIEELEVHVEYVSHILHDTIATLLKHIEIMKDESISLSSMAKSQGENMSHKDFYDFMAKIDDLIQALKAISPHISAQFETPLFLQRWQGAEKQLLKSLRELIGASENRDYVLTADILEYEVEGALTMWHDIISSVN